LDWVSFPSDLLAPSGNRCTCSRND